MFLQEELLNNFKNRITFFGKYNFSALRGLEMIVNEANNFNFLKQ
jgi:hypothetical protein